MAAGGGGDAGEIVTKFLLSTCRLCPPPSRDAVRAAIGCAKLAVAIGYAVDEADGDFVPLTAGSAAEFYIEPMFSCVGDIDTMFHLRTELALPGGHPPPETLPADFHSRVRLYEIVDSEWPCYVYLRESCVLAEWPRESRFVVSMQSAFPTFVANAQHSGSEMHGPARLQMVTSEHVTGRIAGNVLAADAVHCVRCLVWPPQAADWPTRQRKYGWPDSATVDRVLSNGCDVVGVAHPRCREDEWKAKHQWRLSFSRAEIALLNSWMPVQQIVYHMLRVFVKTERLTDSADDSAAKTLSNYHVKTLLLWAGELKSRDWWIGSSNYVRVCSKLLHTLAVWLSSGRCRQYFDPGCNLLDQAGTSDSHVVTARRLMSVTEPWLSAWFVRNYIRTCADLCGDNITRLFDNVNNAVELQNAVSAVVNWRLETLLHKRFDTFEGAVHWIAGGVQMHSLTARSTLIWLRETARIDQTLVGYFIAVAFLHVAQKLAANNNCERSCEFVAVLTPIFLHLSNKTEALYRNPNSCVQLLRTSAALLKLAASKPLDTMELIQIELSKTHLHRSLSCRDADSDSIYCLANIYLAVLYYITGQYQTAIDHCRLATTGAHNSDSHVVGGEVLPMIDDDVDIALGLIVLYRRVRTEMPNEQQKPKVDGVFTTDFFAHYMYAKCLSATKRCSESESANETFRRCHEHLRCSRELLIAEILLSKCLQNRVLLRGFAGEKRASPARRQSSQNLRELLMKSAVEHLTRFRQLEARDFGSVATTMTTDFEALYAYRRGDRRRCLRLCRENARALLGAAGEIPHVSTVPGFSQLMDDDIVSLAGLTLAAAAGRRDFTTLAVTQLTLSLYLLAQCQLSGESDSEPSLTETWVLVNLAQLKIPPRRTLDHLTLRLTERKVLTRLRSSTSSGISANAPSPSPTTVFVYL